MARSSGEQPRRMRRPAHAQPGALASLRWTSALESVAGVGAALAVMAMAIAGGGGTNPAAAVEPMPAPSSDSASSAVTLGWTLQTPASSARTSARVSSPAGPSATPLPTDFAAASALAADGIPLTALQAYQSAAARQNLADPGCHLPWPLVAAIGRVESDHGRFGGAVLHTDGRSTPHIIGIPLDGHGTALVRDTDHGRLDGDKVYDRAVGPMQFIPSTWAAYAVDGNGDGVTDPFNIFDAAAAAARYLCTAGGNLATPAGQQRAVLAYNHSATYLSEVLHLEAVYAAGVPGLTIPIIPTGPPPSVPTDIPPVNPAPPTSISPTTSEASSSSTGPPSRRTTSKAPTRSEPAGTPDSSGSSTGTSSASCSSSPAPTSTSASTTAASSSSAPSSTSASPPCGSGSTTTSSSGQSSTPRTSSSSEQPASTPPTGQ